MSKFNARIAGGRMSSTWPMASLATIAIMTLAILWNASVHGEAPANPAQAVEEGQSRQDPPNNKTIGFSDSRAWLGKLQTRTEVSFVTEPPPNTTEGARELGKITSLGPLVGADLAVANSFADSLLRGKQETLLAHQQSMSPASLSDAYKEADLVLDVEVALAIQEQLRRGSYLVLPPLQQVPDIPGSIKFTMGVKSNGRTANAVFVLLLSDHPSLAALHSYRGSVEQALVDDTIASFNAKPLDERQAMARRHDAIVQMSHQSADDVAFYRQWFPTGATLDRSTWTLGRRPGHQ